MRGSELKEFIKPAKKTTSLFAQFARPASSAPATPAVADGGSTPGSSGKRRLPWTTVSTPQNRSSQARRSLPESSLRGSTTFTPSRVVPSAHMDLTTNHVSEQPGPSSSKDSVNNRHETGPGSEHQTSQILQPEKSAIKSVETTKDGRRNGKRPREGEEESPVFREFVQAWKRLGPSGAFASELGRRDGYGKRERRPLNVLEWEL